MMGKLIIKSPKPMDIAKFLMDFLYFIIARIITTIPQRYGKIDAKIMINGYAKKVNSEFKKASVTQANLPLEYSIRNMTIKHAKENINAAKSNLSFE